MTYVGVAGGSHLLRHDREPDRVQPEHARGGHPGHADGAERVLPSPFVVGTAGGAGGELRT